MVVTTTTPSTLIRKTIVGWCEAGAKPRARSNAALSLLLASRKLLESYRQKAIEAALRRIDMIGIAPEFDDEAGYYTRQNALSWRIDPIAATEIDARLASDGFDQGAINTEVYLQAREIFVLFESLLSAAQTKRMLLLREMRNQRFAVLRCVSGTDR